MRKELAISRPMGYWLRANSYATKLQVKISKNQSLEKKYAKHQEAFEDFFSLKPFEKVPLILTVPALLAAMIGQFSILGPVFSNFLFGHISSPITRSLLGLSPILILLGLSIIFGYFAQKVDFRRDEIDYQRINIKWQYLFASLISGGLYIGFIFLSKTFATETNPHSKFILDLLPILGLCELIISAFAINGIILCYAYIVKFVIEKKIESNRSHMIRCAYWSAISYEYYTKYLTYYSNNQDIDLRFEINEKIQAAINLNAKAVQFDLYKINT